MKRLICSFAAVLLLAVVVVAALVNFERRLV
jgi:hypothetical protein